VSNRGTLAENSTENSTFSQTRSIVSTPVAVAARDFVSNRETSTSGDVVSTADSDINAGQVVSLSRGSSRTLDSFNQGQGSFDLVDHQRQCYDRDTIGNLCHHSITFSRMSACRDGEDTGTTKL
jgi:hypothetical protein